MKAVIVAVFALVVAHGAIAAERIALVIGNGAYSSVSGLDNPARDAVLIADTLEELGFAVTRLIDSSQGEMKVGIAKFGRALRQAGPEATGLFYYAGHGVQSFGNNYLLPVDAVVTDAADLDLVGIEAQSVLRQMYSARNKTNIVILDACRNNPFADIPDFGEPGLAEMKAPRGTFLAYATSPGAVAYDGNAENSPFSASLARHMREPGVQIEQVFKHVRVDVLETTQGLQTPWDTSSLIENFAFNAVTPMSAEELAERQFFDSIAQTGDAVQIMLFLRAYPKSRYESEARALLNKAMQSEIGKPAAAAVQAGPSPEEQAAFEAAQAEASVAGYRAFIERFPDGTFAEFVRGEIDTLSKGTGHDPVGEGVTETAALAPAPADAVPATADVRFDTPLTNGGEGVLGRTIAELIAAEPLFAPIEGIPDEMWKGQTCANCHNWERANICEQAGRYLASNAEASLKKPHPYGGSFKSNLRNWAAGGCN